MSTSLEFVPHVHDVPETDNILPNESNGVGRSTIARMLRDLKYELGAEGGMGPPMCGSTFSVEEFREFSD